MLSFLEFIQASRDYDSYFGKHIGIVTPTEYETMTKVFQAFALEDEVTEVMSDSSVKKASRRLLSLLALMSEVNRENYQTWIDEPEHKSEVERLIKL